MKYKETYDLVCPDSSCNYSEQKGLNGLTAEEPTWYCPKCGKRMRVRSKK